MQKQSQLIKPARRSKQTQSSSIKKENKARKRARDYGNSSSLTKRTHLLFTLHQISKKHRFSSKMTNNTTPIVEIKYPWLKNNRDNPYYLKALLPSQPDTANARTTKNTFPRSPRQGFMLKGATNFPINVAPPQQRLTEKALLVFWW